MSESTCLIVACQCVNVHNTHQSMEYAMIYILHRWSWKKQSDVSITALVAALLQHASNVFEVNIVNKLPS